MLILHNGFFFQSQRKIISKVKQERSTWEWRKGWWIQSLPPPRKTVEYKLAIGMQSSNCKSVSRRRASLVEMPFARHLWENVCMLCCLVKLQPFVSPQQLTHVQKCRLDSIRKSNILFVVDRKITFHYTVLSIRPICRMEKTFPDPTSTVVDRNIAFH